MQGSKLPPVYIQERRTHKITLVSEWQTKFYILSKIALVYSLLQSLQYIFNVEIRYRKLKEGKLWEWHVLM